MNSFFKKLQGIFVSETEAAPEVQLPPAPVESPPVVESPALIAVPPVTQPTESLRPKRERPPQPTVPLIDAKVHFEWILQQVSECAKALVTFAESKQFLLVKPPGEVGVLGRSDVTALMLGYKLVNVAYRRLHPDPVREVSRPVRGAMVSMLLKAGRDHMHQLERLKIDVSESHPIFSLEKAEEHIKEADLQVAAVLTGLVTSNSTPWKEFLPGLTPAFGDAANFTELEQNFSQEIQILFSKVEQTLPKVGPGAL